MKSLFYFLFLVIAIIIDKSFALECYNCDSDFDPNCHNMYSRDVRTENCDESRMYGYQRAACVKTVTFEYGNNRRTRRQCAKVGPRVDPCFESYNMGATVCELCDHHLCNGSIRSLGRISWILLIPTALMIAKKFL